MSTQTSCADVTIWKSYAALYAAVEKTLNFPPWLRDKVRAVFHIVTRSNPGRRCEGLEASLTADPIPPKCPDKMGPREPPIHPYGERGGGQYILLAGERKAHKLWHRIRFPVTPSTPFCCCLLQPILLTRMQSWMVKLVLRTAWNFESFYPWHSFWWGCSYPTASRSDSILAILNVDAVVRVWT